jgi:hypothetical protein
VENVLENALDAISVGGSVNVHIRSHAGFCEIRIEDDGCGISAENLSRLFAHGGSFGKVNGQGLGLYNTKKSITTWGGTIKCENLPQGTRFVITIPLMQTGVVFTTLPKNPRIKVIDDDPQIPGILTQAGFEVLDYASNFSDGQRLLADGTSDDFSILVDMRLGQNNLGTELIAQQLGRKKVFLCTNDFDDLTVIKLAREIGVKIVPKPLCYYGQHRVLLQGNSVR